MSTERVRDEVPHRRLRIPVRSPALARVDDRRPVDRLRTEVVVVAAEYEVDALDRGEFLVTGAGVREHDHRIDPLEVRDRVLDCREGVGDRQVVRVDVPVERFGVGIADVEVVVAERGEVRGDGLVEGEHVLAVGLHREQSRGDGVAGSTDERRVVAVVAETADNPADATGIVGGVLCIGVVEGTD